jgi:NADH-quinone oxidoreductase subunit N
MLIGSVPKLAAFAFVMRILVEGLQPLVQDWSGMLIILSIASMALGNLSAIAQTNIKRMFAYSTITHMGFLLLGLISGGIEGYGASMFYAVVYMMMSLGAFGMIMLLSRAGFEADTLDDFKGLNQRSPWLAFMMMLLMLSMAGIPPTVGFYAKFSLLNSIVQTGHTWLAIVAVMFSLIGAFYYLRVIKLMYFDAPESHAPISVGSDTGLLISINGLGMLFLGLMPGALMSVCAVSVQQSLLLH